MPPNSREGARIPTATGPHHHQHSRVVAAESRSHWEQLELGGGQPHFSWGYSQF